jgi:hypothetical protein
VTAVCFILRLSVWSAVLAMATVTSIFIFPILYDYDTTRLITVAMGAAQVVIVYCAAQAAAALLDELELMLFRRRYHQADNDD